MCGVACVTQVLLPTNRCAAPIRSWLCRKQQGSRFRVRANFQDLRRIFMVLRMRLSRAVVNSAMYDAAMNRPSDLAAFILAGGKSMRMGSDKAFVTFNGRTLLERACSLACSVTADVRIVGDRAKFAEFAPVVEDIFSGCGPLGGIHASLCASSSDLNLMLAVDMPFVTTGLLNHLIARARDSTATVTVPRSEGGFQPLCAVYRRTFADVAQHALKQGRYKIDALFASESTQVISQDDLKGNGFSMEIFRNVNTPEELAEARSRGA
jgi:molybdenum cofactor guanylyltransferase